ncbi:MAG: porin family protein [Tabrizicola sp.]|nr:porin family protein [Tabrizicola sp.]
MKRIAALLLSTTVAMPAFAGGPVEPIPEPEVIVDTTPIVEPSYDWSGFYVGAQLGYADIDSNGGGLDGNGGLGGVHAGYRWDFGQFVAGAEVDYDAADIDLGADLGTLDSVARLKLIGGADLGRSFVYGTAGAARADATVGGADLSDTGYFLGAGMDFAVSDQWTVGGELVQHRFSDFDGSGVDLDATTLKAKVGFRF